jgi:DNA invertase Pin-like site-specific DNA recombinase
VYKVKRVSLYARVSHEEQAKFGISVDNQIDRLKEYAKRENLQIVDIFIDEGFSAGTTKRPALQEMLSRLKEFDEILFTKLDRFTRNVLDANEMVKVLQRQGVAIKAIDEEDIDTTTADGEFLFNMKVSLAQRELKKGSERITTVFDYMVKQGKPISGSQPYGYKIETKADGSKRIIKDTETEQIVDEIFAHFITYQSIRGTARHINEKYNLDRSYNRYNALLKDEYYAGIYRGNNDYAPQYITKEAFDRIQEIIKNNIKLQKTNHIHLFSSLMRCDKCGGKLQTHHSKRKNKNGTTKEYTYYRCRTVIAQPEPCNVKYKEELIEEKLLQNIKQQAEEYIYKASAEPTEATDNSKEIKELLEEIDRLNYQFRKKRVSQKDYDIEYEELEKRLARLEREAPEQKDITGIEAFLNSGWENVYVNLSRENKRALIRSVVKSMVFDDNGELLLEFV